MGATISNVGGNKALTFIDGISLSEQQIRELTESWDLVYLTGDAERIGAYMFKHMFERSPETFAFFENMSGDPNWENSAPYKHHCKVVVNVIGTTVKALRTPDILDKNVNFLGLKHCLLEIKPEHFVILGEEFVKGYEEIVTSEKFPPSVKEAWAIFYSILSLTIQKYMKFYTR